MKRSKEKWESSIRVKEDTEEIELTSGGREFHRRYEGRTVQRGRTGRELNGPSVTETVFASIIYRLWNAGGETGRSLVVHEFPEVDKLCSTATPGKCGPSQLFQ